MNVRGMNLARLRMKAVPLPPKVNDYDRRPRIHPVYPIQPIKLHSCPPYKKNHCGGGGHILYKVCRERQTKDFRKREKRGRGLDSATRLQSGGAVWSWQRTPDEELCLERRKGGESLRSSKGVGGSTSRDKPTSCAAMPAVNQRSRSGNRPRWGMRSGETDWGVVREEKRGSGHV